VIRNTNTTNPVQKINFTAKNKKKKKLLRIMNFVVKISQISNCAISKSENHCYGRLETEGGSLRKF